MEPFRIQCVTCMAGLVVRNPAMVGQIVGCPKCGSMVHVVPPAAAGVSGATVAVEAGQRPAAVDAPLSVPAFDDVDQLDAPVASSQAVEGPVATTAVPQTPPAAPAVAAPWSGAKLATMAVGSFVLGSALVAGVLTALRSSESPADFGAAPEASEPAVVAAPKADLLPPAPDESARLESAEPAPAAVAASAEPSKPAPLIRTDVPPADAANDMGDDIPPPAPQPPGTVAVAVPPADAVAATAPAPRLHIDPLQFDPEGIDMLTLLRGETRDPLSAGVEAARDAPRPEPTAEAGALEAAPLPSGAPREAIGPPANVETLLARRLPALRAERMPLARFLFLMSEMSGLPVSVQPGELRLAAVTAEAPTSLDSPGAPVLEMLTAALQPLRLAPAADGPQIVLRRIAPPRRRVLEYPVGDLATDDGDADRLAQWVQQLVAPATWAARGGEGTIVAAGATLQIDHQERVGYEAILFLERYRAAAKLPLRSKYPPALLAPDSSFAAARRRLSETTTFTFSQPTALQAAAAWWQDELGLAVLVDWPALGQERLWPASPMVVAAIDQPWGEALSAALAPAGLGWRLIDGRTIEITSLERLAAEPQTAFYRLAAGAAADGQRLAAALAAEGPADAAVVVDADRGILIARLAAPAQRRLAESLAAERLLLEADE